MRELCVMAFGKLRSEWDRTASIMAVLINVNKAEAGRPVEPRDLNPFRAAEALVANPAHDKDWHFERRLSVLPLDEQRRIREKLRSGESN